MQPMFLGIDLAVSHLDTGVCLLSLGPRGWRVSFDRARRRDPALARLIDETIDAGGVVAVDVPLGWPKKFVEFLTSDDLVAAMRGHGDPDDAPRFGELRYRVTDLALRREFAEARVDERMYPLSVSTDKLGAATMRWYAIRALMGNPSRLHAHVIEVYPAAARKIWGVREGLQPGDLGMDWELIGFRGRPDVTLQPNPHELDAFVAALVAMARDRRWTRAIAGDPAEGEIVVPRRKGDLERLVQLAKP